tara:strand:- start:173788 stop:174045 length:258 start_codon:yes stop_codon:yes gene_type:complete
MKMNKSMISVLAAGLLVLGLAACEKKGPAEQAGEKIDNAMDSAGSSMSKAAEDVKDGAADMSNEAGKKMDQAGEKIQESANDAKN